MTTKYTLNEGRIAVKLTGGYILGHIWQTPYGWFADPTGSQIQTIPCKSKADAMETVDRLGEREYPS